MGERATSTSTLRLTGTVHPKSYFQFVEHQGLDWQTWDRVVAGDLTGAVFRQVLPRPVCERIRENFWASSALKGPEDGLPAHGRAFIGAPIFAPTLDAYLSEAEHLRDAVSALFDGTDDALPKMLREFGRHLAHRGVTFRLVEHEGRKAAMFKMRSWRNTGTFVLVPHDDAGIAHSPVMAGSEIARLRRIVGAVACVENGVGGELQYWNISPDRRTRKALGFEHDSVGYPLDSLTEFEKLTVEVEPGDIYLFDSSKVHAVGRKMDDTTHRTNVLWSMGVLDDTTFVHWA